MKYEVWNGTHDSGRKNGAQLTNIPRYHVAQRTQSQGGGEMHRPGTFCPRDFIIHGFIWALEQIPWKLSSLPPPRRCWRWLLLGNSCCVEGGEASGGRRARRSRQKRRRRGGDVKKKGRGEEEEEDCGDEKKKVIVFRCILLFCYMYPLKYTISL